MAKYDNYDEMDSEWEPEASSSLAVEQTMPSIPTVAGFAREEESSAKDMRMGQASVRAAFVACVSAAAIGGARHALELVCS